MAQPLPVGITDFKQLIDGGYFYADKTLFIDELIHQPAPIVAICRPPRFGKSLTLSMLRYFFEQSDQSQEALFQNMAIRKRTKSWTHQGQYAVICVSFAQVDASSFEEAQAQCITSIAEELNRHRITIETHTGILDNDTLQDFAQFAQGHLRQRSIAGSLKLLSFILHKVTGKKIVLLIDDHDIPVATALRHGFYEEMNAYMGALISHSIENNQHIDRAILMGTTRPALADTATSRAHYVHTETMLSPVFGDKFGFTQDEVNRLLHLQELTSREADIKSWYGGYQAGDAYQLYNPYSVLQSVANVGRMGLHWANPGESEQLRTLLIQSPLEFKQQFEGLFTKDVVSSFIETIGIRPGLEASNISLFSWLFAYGYVTIAGPHEAFDDGTAYVIKLPNRELTVFFEQLFTNIFNQCIPGTDVDALLRILVAGDGDTLNACLAQFIANSTALFKLGKNDEKCFEFFILGLLVLMCDFYDVQAAGEALEVHQGLIFTPKNRLRVGIVIVCQPAEAGTKDYLDNTSHAILEHLEASEPVNALRSQAERGVTMCAIAYHGKLFAIATTKI